jgi:hypothetical protein
MFRRRLQSTQERETADLSAIVPMERKAMMREWSGLEPLFCQRPREDMKSPWDPLGLEMMVERPPSVSRGLDSRPTRTGSLDVESENVLHSDVLEEKTWPLITHTIRKPSDETVYATYLDGNCNESYPNERMK